jgi:hypothetical protein
MGFEYTIRMSPALSCIRTHQEQVPVNQWPAHPLEQLGQEMLLQSKLSLGTAGDRHDSQSERLSGFSLTPGLSVFSGSARRWLQRTTPIANIHDPTTKESK